MMADGNTVAFDKSFSNAVDGNDALKMLNSGENFGLKRAGNLLSIEAKAPVSISDTLYYNMSNLKVRTYQLRFAPVNMKESSLGAFLIDKFLNTSTSISLSDSSFVNIEITGNTASSAADRFKIVFRQMAPLPVTITSVKAYQKDTDIIVAWSVENENGMQQYDVEKSADGNTFTKAATINASNGNIHSYQWLDGETTGNYYYYRIRSISQNGQLSYTQIVKVQIEKRNAGISVYPNPIINGTINLKLTSQITGVYQLRLLSSLGQILISKEVTYSGGSDTKSIPCGNLSKGIYQLKVTTPSGNKYAIKIMKVE